MVAKTVVKTNGGANGCSRRSDPVLERCSGHSDHQLYYLQVAAASSGNPGGSTAEGAHRGDGCLDVQQRFSACPPFNG